MTKGSNSRALRTRAKDKRAVLFLLKMLLFNMLADSNIVWTYLDQSACGLIHS
jgi:hypothetical protein